jgi:hypothetical protein
MSKNFSDKNIEENPNESNSSLSSRFSLFKKPNKINLIKNKEQNYNLDVITSKLKPNVSFLDKEHQLGKLNLGKGAQSQKFPIYRDKLINLNCINFESSLYGSEADFESNDDLINAGQIKCNLDLNSAINNFKQKGVNLCYNYKRYKNKINIDTDDNNKKDFLNNNYDWEFMFKFDNDINSNDNFSLFFSNDDYELCSNNDDLNL